MIPRENTSMKKIYVGFFIFLAFALQIQITLFVSDNYAGLRVNTADILMPFMGFIIILSLLFKKSNWPKFYIKYAYLWLIGLSLIMPFALINGYFTSGEWNQWGLINKLIGWFVLLGYFLLGGWLAYNSKKESLLLFIKIIVYFFVILTSIISLLVVFQSYGINNNFYKLKLPIEGFMANKNSFVFLTLSILAFATCFQKIIFPNWLVYFLWFLIPLIFIYTGARAGILAFPFVFFTLFFLTKKTVSWKKINLSLLSGIILLVLIQSTSSTNIFMLYSATTAQSIKNLTKKSSSHNIENNVAYKGDAFRLKVLDTTKNMIMERPILGSGLGAAKIEQEKQWDRFYAIIDCTPLWLWAETGLLGLTAFLLFYFICLKYLWKTNHNLQENNIKRALSQSVLVTMIVFALMCLFHELLYTRFLWFFMGLALAYPSKEKG